MKTILFDLDGTLLPMDTERFMYLYGKAVARGFSDFNEPDQLFRHVMTSVKHTIMNKEKRKNADVFFEDFARRVQEPVEAYSSRFKTFYNNHFDSVQSATQVSVEIVEAVKVLKEKNYQLIIATNPIFPMEANRQRIKWAGLDISDFDYVSSFEENHYCKPHIEFYQEVLEINGIEAKEVLMVGNDVQEDLVISALGSQTYLIEDHMIHRGGEIESEHRGNYQDFLTFVKGLPHL